MSQLGGATHTVRIWAQQLVIEEMVRLFLHKDMQPLLAHVAF